MTDVATEARPSEAAAAVSQACDWHGCERQAVVVLRFRGQFGHVHDCAQHAAELREFCDVAESRPLPCPWSHGDGRTWVDRPRDL